MCVCNILAGPTVPCGWVWIAPFFVFDFRDVAHFRSGGVFGVLVVRLCHLVQLSFFGPMFSFEAERPAPYRPDPIYIYIVFVFVFPFFISYFIRRHFDKHARRKNGGRFVGPSGNCGGVG